MGRVRKRTPELRDHVLAVAVELLANDGVSGFTARRVAAAASTSTPAVYELFGDKAGLLREVYFAGFRLLGDTLSQLEDNAEPRADLVRLVGLYRGFIRENPVLAEVMFSRPFSDFDPGPAELRATSSVRVFIVGRVRRAVEARELVGDATDIAHVLVALLQGLAAAENAGRLGTSRASIERRWRLGVDAVLTGMRA